MPILLQLLELIVPILLRFLLLPRPFQLTMLVVPVAIECNTLVPHSFVLHLMLSGDRPFQRVQIVQLQTFVP